MFRAEERATAQQQKPAQALPWRKLEVTCARCGCESHPITPKAKSLAIVCVGIGFAKNVFTVHVINEKRCSAAQRWGRTVCLDRPKFVIPHP